jgi:hypothetical protein
MENEESSSFSMFLVLEMTTDFGTFNNLRSGRVPPPRIIIVKRTTAKVVVTRTSRFGPCQLIHKVKAIAPLNPL